MRECYNQWAVSVMKLAGEWQHTCHTLTLLNPSKMEPSQLFSAPQWGCASFNILCYAFKNLVFIFYLLLSKGILIEVHCLQPIQSLLNNPPNPRVILIAFFVPYASEHLTILNYCYFLKSNSTPPSEFHFRILVLLLFLGLFLSSCFVLKILTMRRFDMLQNFFCSFRELLERVQLHNVPGKQGHAESFEFTSTNISWAPTLYQGPWQVQRWIKKEEKVSFVEILRCYVMCQYHDGDIEVFQLISFP